MQVLDFFPGSPVHLRAMVGAYIPSGVILYSNGLCLQSFETLYCASEIWYVICKFVSLVRKINSSTSYMCNKILTHLKAGAQKKIVLGPETNKLKIFS
jgi:hypothetical protein